MSTKVSALTAATNAELNDGTLAYVVIDPGGTPASKKTTVTQLSGVRESFVDDYSEQMPSGFGVLNPGSYSTGLYFIALRTGQTCRGVRVYWNGSTAVTLTLRLWESGVAGHLATVDVTTTTTPGVYEGTFASPVSLARNTAYAVTVYNTSLYQNPDAPPNYGYGLQIQVLQKYRDFQIVTWGAYGAGNTRPVSFSVNGFYPVEPLLNG